jgi:hypothetical protein
VRVRSKIIILVVLALFTLPTLFSMQINGKSIAPQVSSSISPKVSKISAQVIPPSYISPSTCGTSKCLTISSPSMLFNGTAIGSNVTVHYVFQATGQYLYFNFIGPSVLASGNISVGSIKATFIYLTIHYNNVTLVESSLNSNSSTIWYVFHYPTVPSLSVTEYFTEEASNGFISPNLNVTIKGTLPSAGYISVVLSNLAGKAQSINTYEMDFGGVGFNWADSPSAILNGATVSFPVNTSFLIDPTTVTTSTVISATNENAPPFFNQGAWFVGFSDGTYFDIANTTNHGSTFSTPVAIATAANSVVFAWNISGNTLTYIRLNNTLTKFYWRQGTLSAANKITWGAAEAAVVLPNAASRTGSYPSIAVDSLGNIFVSFGETDSTTFTACGGTDTGFRVMEYSSSVWTTSDSMRVCDVNILSSSLSISGIGASSNIVFQFQYSGIGIDDLVYSLNDGSTWSGSDLSSVISLASGYNPNGVIHGSTYYYTNAQNVGGGLSFPVYFQTYPLGGSPSIAQTLATGAAGSLEYPAMSFSGNAIFITSSYLASVWYENALSPYSTWSSNNTVNTGEASPATYLAASLSSDPSGYLAWLWTSGAGSPWNVRFASQAPTLVNTAESSSSTVTLTVRGSGDVIVLAFSAYAGANTITVTGISDTFSDGYSVQEAAPVVAAYNQPGYYLYSYIYSATSRSSGSDTISISFGGGSAEPFVYAYDVLGISATASAVNANTSSTATGSTPKVASTSYGANSFIVAVEGSVFGAVGGYPTISVGSGFTNFQQLYFFEGSEYNIPSGSGN